MDSKFISPACIFEITKNFIRNASLKVEIAKIERTKIDKLLVEEEELDENMMFMIFLHSIC